MTDDEAVANGSDGTTTSSLRFPTGRYPTGWFPVGWTSGLARGDVERLHYFGRELVMWRSEAGVAHVSDAQCLHLGAHLGVRGRVEGEEIVCPWHGWHWDGEGRNTLIPFSEQTCKPNLRLTTWEVREWYGYILVWHDLKGRPPMWEMPSIQRLDDGECRPFTQHKWTITAHIQNVVDNIADPTHFVYVHGSDAPPTLSDYRFDGPFWRAQSTQELGGGRESTWLTPDGAVTATSDFFVFGLGIMGVEYPELLGGGFYIGGTTPIDETHCDHWFAVNTSHETSEAKHDQVVTLQLRLTEMDFFTWEHMQILDAPNLAPEEAKYLVAVRRWGRQFYPEYDDTNADGAPVTIAVT